MTQALATSPSPSPPPASPPTAPRSRRTSRLQEFVNSGKVRDLHQMRRDASAMLKELARAKELLQALRDEERRARKYPWPPRSPASRVQEALSAGQSPDPADIAAVLNTYGLLVLVSKRGETDD